MILLLILATISLLFTQMPCEAKSFRLKRKSDSVLFATTRLNTGSKHHPVYGGSRNLEEPRGKLEYGSARVIAPRGLEPLASAGLWRNYKQRLKTSDAAWQETRVRSLRSMSETKFGDTVRQWRGIILLFIHGYDESLETALRDTAVIANELERRSRNKRVMPILFSWPSLANRAEYAADEASLSWSRAPFNRFIKTLEKNKAPDAPLYMVAHSLGSRLAFSLVDAETDSPPLLDKLVLSSSDYDYYSAIQRLDRLEKMVDQKVFVLVSERDGPLITSQLLHGSPRLGRPFDPPRVSRKPSDYKKESVWKHLLSDVADILFSPEPAFEPEADWLERHRGADRELGEKARFVDVTELVSADFGHRLAWPVIAGLLSGESLTPLATTVVHHKPDANLLEQAGNHWLLFRFHRISRDRFGGRSDPGL